MSTVFGDTQVAHVAPRVVGSGSVHRGSCVVDIGKTCKCDRYDERRMYLSISIVHHAKPRLADTQLTYPGLDRLNPDTQSSTSLLPTSVGGIKLLTYSTLTAVSSSPPLCFLTQASKDPRKISPSTKKSNGIGFLAFSGLLPRTLLISSES